MNSTQTPGTWWVYRRARASPMVVTLNLQPTLALTDAQFAQICGNNRDLRFERTAQVELVIMSLTWGETGERNAEINTKRSRRKARCLRRCWNIGVLDRRPQSQQSYRVPSAHRRHLSRQRRVLSGQYLPCCLPLNRYQRQVSIALALHTCQKLAAKSLRP